MMRCLLLNENKQERHESHKKTSTAFTLAKPLFRVGMNVILGPSSAERHQAACLGFSAALSRLFRGALACPCMNAGLQLPLVVRNVHSPAAQRTCSSVTKFGSGDIGSTDVHMAH